MVSCSCCGLTSKGKAQDGSVTFHRFPRDPSAKAQWVAFVTRQNWELRESSRLCSRHFTDDCFNNATAQRRTMKDGSIPTLECALVATKNLRIEKRNLKPPPLDEAESARNALRKFRKTKLGKSLKKHGKKSKKSYQTFESDIDSAYSDFNADSAVDQSDGSDYDDPNIIFHPIEDIYYESDSDCSYYEEETEFILNSLVDGDVKPSSELDKAEKVHQKCMKNMQIAKQKFKDKLRGKTKNIRILQKTICRNRARIRDYMLRLEDMKELLYENGISYKVKDQPPRPPRPRTLVKSTSTWVDTSEKHTQVDPTDLDSDRISLPQPSDPEPSQSTEPNQQDESAE